MVLLQQAQAMTALQHPPRMRPDLLKRCSQSADARQLLQETAEVDYAQLGDRVVSGWTCSFGERTAGWLVQNRHRCHLSCASHAE